MSQRFPSAGSTGPPGTPQSRYQEPQIPSNSDPPQSDYPIQTKGKLEDETCPQKVLDLIPESQASMNLLSFEHKLDGKKMQKRLVIQEALKLPRPMNHKRKLWIIISDNFYPSEEPIEGGDAAAAEGTVSSWDLRIEGGLEVDAESEPNKIKRKFTSFFKTVEIKLDEDLYVPEDHRFALHRTHTTEAPDGFLLKGTGDRYIRCAILLMLDYPLLQYEFDSRLARLLGDHKQTRPAIITALWQYVKSHKLQDSNEREFINCDKYLEQIFGCHRMKFSEIPQRLNLNPLLQLPIPILINHVISEENGAESNHQRACYTIDLDFDELDT